MRFLLILVGISLCSCNYSVDTPKINRPFVTAEIASLYNDSSSIRAVEVTDNEVMYAGSNGFYGFLNFDSSKTTVDTIIAKNSGHIDFMGTNPSFRALGSTDKSFFILSIGQPALLYQIDKWSKEISLVYKEDTEGVFYDALTFWNDQEGIAMGDPTDDCISILITRDGGSSWNKVDCTKLPKFIEGEAAFAASDTNIKTIGDATWIATGGIASRIFYSGDKGKSWVAFDTPIVQGTTTQGVYSMDFYDKDRGIIYGGDYTIPKNNYANIATTTDGGQSWNLIASGANDGYKSCVQYVPNSDGRGIVALGFTGISYSSDSGNNWVKLSDEPFLSFRFKNDSIAYATGSNKIARIRFKY